MAASVTPAAATPSHVAESSLYEKTTEENREEPVHSANFKVGVDNSPELLHEFNFSMAHSSARGRNFEENDDDDDLNFVVWDDNDQDDLSNLIAIQRVDSRDVVFDNRQKKAKILGKYIMGGVLGEGSYAKVKEAIDQENLCRRAVKIMKRKKLKKIPHGEENVEREIGLVRGLRHKNVMRLIEVFYNEEKGKIYMVLEYCCAVLKDMLDCSPVKKFPAWQAHYYFGQLLAGLEYLHSNRIIHKDIKPGNLLLDTAGVLKIADFGVAEQLDLFAPNDMITISQGTPAFQPPEVASGATEFSGFNLDIWSCGVTLFNFVTGSYPFEGETIFRLFENIAKCEFEVPRGDVDPLLETLLRGMLSRTEDRLSLAKVQQHDWCRKNHPCTAPPVTITPKGEDPTMSTTVLPFLVDLHLPHEAEGDDDFITEHDLHEHKKRLEAEAAALAVGHFADSRRNSKATKCIKVKKIGRCSIS